MIVSDLKGPAVILPMWHWEQISAENDRLYRHIDELAAALREFEAYAWDGDPKRRAEDPLCVRATELLQSVAHLLTPDSMKEAR